MEINEQPKSVRDPNATKAAASEHQRLRAFFSTQQFHSEWPRFVMRTAELPGVFKAENVEFPESWSQNAINITYDKYFRYVEQEGSTAENGVLARETSVKQMINRVVDTLVKWGLQFGHLRDELEARVFAKELTFILVTQRASFNSPVWFNIGTRQGRIGEEQASACMPYDMRVNTNFGMVPIGEIVRYVNDPVNKLALYTFDQQGQKTKILKGICNGKRTVMALELSDGSELRLTSNHVVFVRTADGALKELCAGDLQEGDSLVLSRSNLLGTMPVRTGGFLAVTDDTAWLAGMMVGNGYSGRAPTATSDTWEIKVNTIAQRERAEAELARNGVPFTTTEFHWGFCVRGYGAAGRAFWQRLSLWNHTGAKVIPEWVFWAPTTAVSHFLLGLFDTDGTVVSRPNDRVAVQLSNVSYDVVSGAQKLLRSMGIFSTLRDYDDERTDSARQKIYYLTVNDMHSVDWYARRIGFVHTEKASKLAARRAVDEDIDYKQDVVKVVGKHRVGQELVYDIQTESGTFWAEGILVHNCFINGIGDDMESILELSKTEGMLYKGGSGSGINYSPLRSSVEKLSGGGTASGPVPFIAAHDANGGAIKSGGTTRRAAKMSILNADHGDIEEFITCKAKAERMARALIDAGFDGDFRARFGAYQSVPFQNANHSVRVTDAFMRAVEKDGDWDLMARDGKTVLSTVRARHLWDLICDAAWECGDPGLQFDTIINHMHTCPADGRINASNPCQPAWATVLTRDGIKTFADIDAGSEIWSGKQWTKVVRKVATGVKPVYRFHTRAGIFAGTAEHRVISNGVRVEAQHAESIDTAQGPLASTLPCDAQAVVDGLVFGDGSVKLSNDGVDHYPLLYVGENDQSYFADPKIAEFINKRPFDTLCHRVNTTLTKEELPRTYLRQIPARFFGGDEVQTTSFLRGLYSANGSVVGQRITLKAASFVVISQVQEMLSALGIRSYYTTNKPTDVEFGNGVYTSKESYDLNISTSREDFARLIGFIQPYKQEKLNEILNTEPAARGPKVSYDVVSKHLVGEEPVWDIEVEAEEHTYWTGGLLVSNCSEYMHLDDSACNLASLNLRKFQKPDGSLDVEQYEQATDVMILAMDILVDGAKYPTEKIGNNARKFRQLGLGYANLGAFLMNAGLPYDSDEGRYVTGLLTAKLCGRAYRQSAHMAEYLGAFAGYSRNAGAMLDVIDSHMKNLCELHDNYDSVMLPWYDRLYVEARRDWEDAAKHGTLFGFRNSQVTVLAPTGTIAFMMDCDTTGIEPDTSLVKSKKLVGGGTMKIVNEGVYAALARLGYSDAECSSLVGYMLTHGSFVGSALKEEHLPVFDTSFAEPIGKRALRPEAHVLMLAAAQPFISGAISKTCNLPESATREDVGNLYMLAWRKGLKAIALYRDGCKRSQPLSVAHAKETAAATSASAKLIEEQLAYIGQLKEQIADLQEKTQARRRKLPDERQAITHKFKITTKDQEMKVYLNCGMYPDGSLGEIFIKSDKEGSTVSGLLDGIATLTSFALQHGVPLASLVQKFKRTAFEPHGWTGNPEIKYAASVLDYIFRYLELRFLNKQPIEVVSVPASEFQAELDRIRAAAGPSKELLDEHEAARKANGHANGNGAQVAGEKVQRPCPKCGGVMRRTGACVTCEDCGENTGCG